MKQIVLNILLALAIILCCVASVVIIYDARTKILSKLSNYGANFNNDLRGNEELANEILKQGGYILFFRHAEREKWIDVAMYDALESNHLPNAENRFYSKAVCLSSRGEVQARAMGEVVQLLKIPVSYIVSSPSCRARQTGVMAFGRIDEIDHVFMHRGPYNETVEDHLRLVREKILAINVSNKKNVVITAHNGVVFSSIFDKMLIPFDDDLEEGGFYVISSENNKLTLEGYFNNFHHFYKIFESRNSSK